MTKLEAADHSVAAFTRHAAEAAAAGDAAEALRLGRIRDECRAERDRVARMPWRDEPVLSVADALDTVWDRTRDGGTPSVEDGR